MAGHKYATAQTTAAYLRQCGTLKMETGMPAATSDSTINHF